MQIHNYFSDLLLSIRTLFDNIIFKPNFIKYYSFNIANRTFELSQNDYKPNRELPAAIISLNDERYSFSERPTNIQNLTIENINQIPVLFDVVTDQYIFVQEEQVNVPITVNINCESQFQAKEVEFYIKRFLPLNKYIQLYAFTSFLEIDPHILFKLKMDYTQRDITNLFTRLNKNLGKAEYCFSIRYEPLVRLESIDPQISSSTLTKFTTNMQLDMLIQMPLHFLYNDPKPIIETINVDFTRFGHEPISENSMRSVTGTCEQLRLTTPNKLVRRNLLVHDLEEFSLDTLIVNEISYKLFAITFEFEDFIIKENFEFNFFDVNTRFHRNIKPTLLDTDTNTVKFQFTEEEYNNYFKAEMTKPIIVQFVERMEDLL